MTSSTRAELSVIRKNWRRSLLRIRTNLKMGIQSGCHRSSRNPSQTEIHQWMRRRSPSPAEPELGPLWSGRCGRAAVVGPLWSGQNFFSTCGKIGYDPVGFLPRMKGRASVDFVLERPASLVKLFPYPLSRLPDGCIRPTAT